MQVTTENNLIKIQFKYDPRVKNLVTGLPLRTYNPSNKTWYIPVDSTYAPHSINLLASRGFQIGQEVYSALGEEATRVDELKTFWDMGSTEFITALPLLPFQKVAAAFTVKAGNAILALDVGLGKSITSIAVCEKRIARKILILCPSILKYQWEAEIEKFLPGEEVQVIEGSFPERQKQWKTRARWYIANYELLLRDFSAMDQDWDIIIADECTRISNHSSKTGKLIKDLRAKYRIAMTGTLISNRPQDCWNVVDWIEPGALGNYYQFMGRYTVKDNWGGVFAYQNLEELAEKMKGYMIRRTKEQCLPDLPELITETVPFDLSNKEKDLYDKLRKELLMDIEQSLVNKVSELVTVQNTVVKMTRLRQLCDSMELLGEGTDSSKLDVLKELIPTLSDRKIIVFTEFAKMADILCRELGTPLKISGDVSSEERQQVLQDFHDNDKYNILVMTSAGQYGLNIQAASVVIHYDQPWSLGKLTQRVGRAHRMGQKQSVLEFNLVARGTMDSYIVKKLSQKQEISDRIMSVTELKEMLS